VEEQHHKLAREHLDHEYVLWILECLDRRWVNHRRFAADVLYGVIFTRKYFAE
jgi:predicted GTPase